MKSSNILLALILFFSFACSEKNKSPSEAIMGDSASLSEPVNSDPALLALQQDSLFVSEFVADKLLNQNQSYAELKQLKQYVPSSYLLYDYLKEDLNGDGLADLLIVVTPTENTVEAGSDLMLLYVGLKDKTFKLHANNGSFGYFTAQAFWLKADSLGGGFTVSTHAAGMGRHAIVTNTTSHFTYNKKDKDWFLTSYCYFTETLGGRDLVDEEENPVLDEEGNYVQDTTEYEQEPLIILEDGEECTRYFTRKDFGKIRFAKYSFEGMSEEQWQN